MICTSSGGSDFSTSSGSLGFTIPTMPYEKHPALIAVWELSQIIQRLFLRRVLLHERIPGNREVRLKQTTDSRRKVLNLALRMRV
jgi:hypothetical protein